MGFAPTSRIRCERYADIEQEEVEIQRRIAALVLNFERRTAGQVTQEYLMTTTKYDISLIDAPFPEKNTKLTAVDGVSKNTMGKHLFARHNNYGAGSERKKTNLANLAGTGGNAAKLSLRLRREALCAEARIIIEARNNVLHELLRRHVAVEGLGEAAEYGAGAALAAPGTHSSAASNAATAVAAAALALRARNGARSSMASTRSTNSGAARVGLRDFGVPGSIVAAIGETLRSTIALLFDRFLVPDAHCTRTPQGNVLAPWRDRCPLRMQYVSLPSPTGRAAAEGEDMYVFKSLDRFEPLAADAIAAVPVADVIHAPHYGGATGKLTVALCPFSRQILSCPESIANAMRWLELTKGLPPFTYNSAVVLLYTGSHFCLECGDTGCDHASRIAMHRDRDAAAASNSTAEGIETVTLSYGHDRTLSFHFSTDGTKGSIIGTPVEIKLGGSSATSTSSLPDEVEVLRQRPSAAFGVDGPRVGALLHDVKGPTDDSQISVAVILRSVVMTTPIDSVSRRIVYSRSSALDLASHIMKKKGPKRQLHCAHRATLRDGWSAYCDRTREAVKNALADDVWRREQSE